VTAIVAGAALMSCKDAATALAILGHGRSQGTAAAGLVVREMVPAVAVGE